MRASRGQQSKDRYEEMESVLDEYPPVSKERGGEMIGAKRNIAVRVRKVAASGIR